MKTNQCAELTANRLTPSKAPLLYYLSLIIYFCFSPLILPAITLGPFNPNIITKRTERSPVPTKQDTTVTIKGRIINESKEGIYGATVQSKIKRSIGTSTDENGRFTLRVPKNSILLIRSLEYEEREVRITGNNSTFTVTLRKGQNELEQVVVVGYGTTSIRKNSTAVATLKPEAVQNLPFNNMGSALQGRIPGVIVQQGSAEPGVNSASISIRGNGDPLYVIDGFISTSTQYFRYECGQWGYSDNHQPG